WRHDRDPAEDSRDDRERRARGGERRGQPVADEGRQPSEACRQRGLEGEQPGGRARAQEEARVADDRWIERLHGGDRRAEPVGRGGATAEREAKRRDRRHHRTAQDARLEAYEE